MRASPKVEPIFIDDVFVGINLAADYTAEHEWGIDDLKRLLGVNVQGGFLNALVPKYGIDKRRVTSVQYVTLDAVGTDLFLRVEAESQRKYGPTTENAVKRCSYRYNDASDFRGAWSGDDLGIVASSSETKDQLTDVFNAMKVDDVAIWLGGGGVFENAGLKLVIISKLPQEIKDQLTAADHDRELLLRAADKTGIEKKIKKAGLEVFALSPQWAKGKNTKHDVVYWLNPCGQASYKTGLFTVEDLELWCQGKGPVVRTEKERREYNRR